MLTARATGCRAEESAVGILVLRRGSPHRSRGHDTGRRSPSRMARSLPRLAPESPRVRRGAAANTLQAAESRSLGPATARGDGECTLAGPRDDRSRLSFRGPATRCSPLAQQVAGPRNLPSESSCSDAAARTALAVTTPADEALRGWRGACPVCLRSHRGSGAGLPRTRSRQPKADPSALQPFAATESAGCPGLGMTDRGSRERFCLRVIQRRTTLADPPPPRRTGAAD